MVKEVGEQMVLGVVLEQMVWGQACVRCPHSWLWLLCTHAFLHCGQHFEHLVLPLSQS